MRLRLIPAIRLLELRYPANDYMNAVRTGKKPRLPRPRPSHAIVYRRDFNVYRREQDPGQFKLLSALARGSTLEEAVRKSVSKRGGNADRLAATLGGWFRSWAAAGVFCGIERVPSGHRR